MDAKCSKRAGRCAHIPPKCPKALAHLLSRIVGALDMGWDARVLAERVCGAKGARVGKGWEGVV